MHGRACEGKKRIRHMRTVPSRATAGLSAVGSSSLVLSSPSSFLKDGREISVGDCALFKPPEDCPPFIGIIRWVVSNKDNLIKLGVNWLYRPAELKLGKGIFLEAAPNEIFYSFHKDEIPAASVLHPCKVAFLPKGAELPPGISSFVCQRVYDITNKCLWWLTDRDYVDAHQAEVDQLLYKTRLEMHAAVPSGGRSPKPVNGPSSTSQLKPGSDSVQNSSSSYPSQARGKKRERMDQNSEPVKRERTSRIDDNESVNSRLEASLKSELAKFTDKGGGLVDFEGVEKLVQLMLTERNEKKIDLTCRSMLASVIAATDKFDCLSRFVQLRGLPVFDEWLQEINKSKIGEGSPRDGDKSSEDFLVILLRALDKLPISLNALQMCNIGKSVNSLRSHKNSEIQRKARSLVDTWKKRVEAEMDMKSGSNQGVSWSAKNRSQESSQAGNRQGGGSSELAAKSTVQHVSAAKSTSIKSVQVENNTKSASASPSPSPSPGSLKGAPLQVSGVANQRDGQSKNCAGIVVSDPSAVAARDEKSSSSSHSHNNSQCSSDHARTGGFCGKEDTRTSTAGSVGVGKTSSGSSRHRRSANGLRGTSPSHPQREIVSSRGSFQRNAVSEKSSQAAVVCEKACDVPLTEANGHKLIVKLPNRGRSPGPGAGGGKLEDPTVMNSRVSSPVLSEKNEQSRERGEPQRVNTGSDVYNEAWQSHVKDVAVGSAEGIGSPSMLPEDEQCRSVEVVRKTNEVMKALSPTSANESKSGKVNGRSLSSINALIESCAKFSETTTMPAGDDVGMNLLASVAASEISKSEMVSPSDSPHENHTSVEHGSTRNDSCPKSSLVKDSPNSDGEMELQNVPHCKLSSKVAEDNPISNSSGEHCRSLDLPGKDILQTVDQCTKSSGESNQAVVPASTSYLPTGNLEKCLDGDRNGGIANDADAVSIKEELVDGASSMEVKAVESCLKVEKEALEAAVAHKLSANDCSGRMEQKSSIVLKSPEISGGEEEKAQISFGSCKGLTSGKLDLKTAKTDEMVVNSDLEPREQITSGDSVASLVPFGTNCKIEHGKMNLESNEVKDQPTRMNISSPLPKETDQQEKTRDSRLSNVDTDGEETTSITGDVSSGSAVGGADLGAKIGFDLNEGINGDDGRNGELSNISGPLCASPIPLLATVTVAAAAKGPFVPPQDLMKNKGALGWKGSAATSAFRPAEPRKMQEIPYSVNTAMSSTNVIVSKQSRPPLDIDLNVPDDRALEDLASRSSIQGTNSFSDPLKSGYYLQDGRMSSTPGCTTGGLDLDLNRVEESSDMDHYMSNSLRVDGQLHSIKPTSGARIDDEAAVGRDFDLNDGPAIDDFNSQPPRIFGQHSRTAMPSQSMFSGLRVNGSDLGNYSSWFPGAANAYSGATIPSVVPDRSELSYPIVTGVGASHRILNPAASPSPFNGAPVLSSSPAVQFQSTPFQYPMFPFGTSFPLPSASFSAGPATYVDSSAGGRLYFPGANSPLLGPTLPVPSNFARPYVVSLPDGTNGAGSENNRKWLRQGLDLNAGPVAHEQDSRDESALALRQSSGTGPLSLTEEQVRMYQISGNLLKRKEPDAGWDVSKPSWR